MLAWLHIRDYVIVEALELDFGPGFTALTGETGAGKSILVGALGLALGQRADAGAVRSGRERAEITAGFDAAALPALSAWLAANDLDADGECVVRRVITREGRSRGYINGRAVPMQTLKEIAPRVLDICGQQAHLSLRHGAEQRRVLDHFGGHGRLVESVAAAHDRWREAAGEHARLAAALTDRDNRRDLLSFQVGELESLAPAAGEEATLADQQRRLAHAAELADGTRRTLDLVYERDEGSVNDALAEAIATLERLAAFDAALKAPLECLRDAAVQVSEAADALRARGDDDDHEPGRLAEVEQRLAELTAVARKHRTGIAELPALWEALRQELAELERGDERLDELAAAEAGAREALDAAAEQLSRARGKAAQKLARKISAQMQDLGMPGGVFEIVVAPRDDGTPRRDGRDRIEFRVSANPGHPPAPLARVASGGELARLGLAIQVVAIAGGDAPTLVFDEVDQGIGGGVAEIVGQRLRELAGQRQVLCVTHLPQVASQAHGHLRVAKVSGDDTTLATVRALSEAERVEEVARMLGGVKITAKTRAHAREMLSISAPRDRA